MRVEGVGNGEPMAARKLQQAKSPVVGLSCSVPTDSACPDLAPRSSTSKIGAVRQRPSGNVA